MDSIRIGFDFETVGKTDQIESVNLTTEAGTHLWDWTPDREGETAQLLGGPGLKIAHNLQFDLRLCRLAGINLAPPHWCTMMAAHLLQPDLDKALQSVATLYLDVIPWKHLGTQNLTYRRMDSEVLLPLQKIQRDKLALTGQLKLFTDTIMPAIPILVDMSIRGLRIDTVARDRWKAELTSSLDRSASTFRAASLRLSGKEVNPDSYPQLHQFLYEKLGLKKQYNPKGKSGEASLTADEGALKRLVALASGDAKLALSTLLQYRTTKKLLSTYTTFGQTVHPTYGPSTKDDEEGFARTGRLAARQPNIMNQPPIARKLFIPHNPKDNILLEADYDKQEIWIQAAYANETGLLSLLRDEQDVYQHLAKDLGVPRPLAKAFRLASQYGAGPRKLAKTLKDSGFDIDTKTCGSLLDRQNRSLPNITKWQSSLYGMAKSNLYVSNGFSRRRYFYDPKPHYSEILNFPPQSTGADIQWTNLPILYNLARELDGYLLTVVHDSVLFEIPKKRLAEAETLIRNVMERIWPQINNVSIPIKIKTGPNWGQLK